VLNLFAEWGSDVPMEEKTTIQKKHPIDPSCHDLWASALTIFQGVYRKREGIWITGREGTVILDDYWYAQTTKEEGTGISY
jgi:hypothetical protein